MAGSEALYQFLTDKMRERGLAVESLPKVLDISRSTLYRNMKGTALMSEATRATLADLMNLDEAERAEFDRLVGLAAFDATLVQARAVIDRFVYPGQPPAPEAPATPIRFALYDRDTYLRTADDIWDQLRSLALVPGAAIQVWMIGCTTEPVQRSVASFLTDLFTSTDRIAVEHLLTLPPADYATAAATFIRLVPMLEFDGYTVRYCGQDTAAGTALFTDTLGVEIRRPDGPAAHFVISFLEHELSTCLATTDRNVFAFFWANFEAARRHHDTPLVEPACVETWNQQFADLAEDTAVYTVKPDFCYQRVPVCVFTTMAARMTPEELAVVRQSLAGPGGDPATSLEMALSTIERRNQGSRDNRHIDVVSVEGLTLFARTGRTSDYLDWMPPIPAADRAVILAQVQARNNDPADPYTLHVTRADPLPGGQIIIVLENKGVLLQYGPEDYRAGRFRILLTTNPTLTEAFSDWVRHHVPAVHALAPEEADSLLTDLIDSLEGTERATQPPR